jgi:hypothetical protein
MAVYSVSHSLSAKVKAKLVYLSEQSLFGDMVTVGNCPSWQSSPPPCDRGCAVPNRVPVASLRWQRPPPLRSSTRGVKTPQRRSGHGCRGTPWHEDLCPRVGEGLKEAHHLQSFSAPRHAGINPCGASIIDHPAMGVLPMENIWICVVFSSKPCLITRGYLG